MSENQDVEHNILVNDMEAAAIAYATCGCELTPCEHEKWLNETRRAVLIKLDNVERTKDRFRRWLQWAPTYLRIGKYESWEDLSAAALAGYEP